MNSANEDSFNMEDFLNFIPAESAVVPEPEVTDTSALWDQYPNLFDDSEKDSESLINFNGASLMKEEYFDPFAILQKSQERETFQFLDKLKLRKYKLEQLAKNLTASPKEIKTGISPLHMKAHLKSHWNNIDQRTVQAFPLFNLSTTMSFKPDLNTDPLKEELKSSLSDLESLVEKSQNLYLKSQTTTVKPPTAEEVLMANVLRETLFTYPSAL